MSKEETPVIRNKLRGLNRHEIQTQPEYERLNIKPTKTIPTPPRKVDAQQVIPSPTVPMRGRGLVVPHQVKVAVGVNEKQIYESDDPNSEEFIDNNDEVDIENLQNIKVNFNEEDSQKVFTSNEESEDYVVLLHGKTIGEPMSLSRAEKLIESIFFSENSKDIGPDDFTVFKKVAVKIGVYIKE